MTRITMEQYVAILEKRRNEEAKKKGLTAEKIASEAMAKHKFGNVKVDTEDGKFDSKRELGHWQELKLLERCGKITDLKRQVPFLLQEKFVRDGKTERKIEYVADFTYLQDGKLHVVDSKGFRTDTYKIKRKLLLYKYPQIIFKEM